VSRPKYVVMDIKEMAVKFRKDVKVFTDFVDKMNEWDLLAWVLDNILWNWNQFSDHAEIASRCIARLTELYSHDTKFYGTTTDVRYSLVSSVFDLMFSLNELIAHHRLKEGGLLVYDFLLLNQNVLTMVSRF
jgi:uncharacterized Fe-S radical SAM superfamily protein PflX